VGGIADFLEAEPREPEVRFAGLLLLLSAMRIGCDAGMDSENGERIPQPAEKEARRSSGELRRRVN